MTFVPLIILLWIRILLGWIMPEFHSRSHNFPLGHLSIRFIHRFITSFQPLVRKQSIAIVDLSTDLIVARLLSHFFFTGTFFFWNLIFEFFRFILCILDFFGIDFIFYLWFLTRLLIGRFYFAFSAMIFLNNFVQLL